MKKKFYVITLFVSLLFVIPSIWITHPSVTILSNIGCSGLAATIIAICLENIIEKEMRISRDRAKKVYFNDLYKQLEMMLERVVWFDDRMNDPDYNWDMVPSEYTSFYYQLKAFSKYADYVLTDSQFAERIVSISNRYSLDNQEKMDPLEKAKTNKMFIILAESGLDVLKQVKMIEDNKNMLDLQDYMSCKDITGLCNQINLSICLMLKEGKNHGVAVQMLYNVYKELMSICGPIRSFRIGLNGTFSLTEL